jgi:hypothetical protein
VAPTAEAAAAVEWQPGEPGCVILVEGNYRRILDGDTDGLLGASRDTGGAALLARWLFFDHLELEARVLQSVGPTGTTARAHVAYKDGAFEARVGTVVATGEATSVGGYFQRNTGAFVALKYAY